MSRNKIRHRRISAAVTVVAATTLAFGTSNTRAAGPVFLKAGDVKGEAIDRDHKRDIEVFSWSARSVRR